VRPQLVVLRDDDPDGRS